MYEPHNDLGPAFWGVKIRLILCVSGALLTCLAALFWRWQS